MRIPENIYKRLQEKYPDLFIGGENTKATSTLFAEFLPGAALADPNGNPWGQYGNREIPPKRKTVVISFKDLENLTFSESAEIDKAARFLKRAGFSVLIPVNDELQEYDMQLFDREHIANVGDKSRAEMQKMAITKNISADELFFIDDVKKELDYDTLYNMNCDFERIELSEIQNGKTRAENYCALPFHDTEEGRILCDDIGEIFDLHEHDKKEKIALVLNDVFLKETDFTEASLLGFLIATFNAGLGDHLQHLDLIKRNDIFNELSSRLSNVLKYDNVMFRSDLRRSLANFDVEKSIKSGISKLQQRMIDYTDSPDTKKEFSDLEFKEFYLTLKKHHNAEMKKLDSSLPESEQIALPNLYKITVHGNNYTNLIEKLIKNESNLEELNFIDTKSFYRIIDLIKMLPGLKILHCNNLYDYKIQALNAPKLIYLELDIYNNCKIELSGLPSLNKLALTVCKQDITIEFSNNFNSNLTELIIRGKLTEIKWLHDLIRNSPKLKSVVLIDPIEIEKIHSLSNEFPGLAFGANALFRYTEDRPCLPGADDRFAESRSDFSRIPNALQKGPVGTNPLMALPPRNSSKPAEDNNTNHMDEGSDENTTYQSTHIHQMKSDFDVKHDPKGTFTMEVACKHLTASKKNRFPYTRDGVYQLDVSGSIIPVNSHVKIEMNVPEKAGQLPSHSSRDFYEFSRKINLNINDIYRLDSLSSDDILFQLKLNGKALSSDDIELTKDELGFYSLKTKKALNGSLTYVMDVPPERESIWNSIPPELQAIIENIKTFPSSGVDTLDVLENETAHVKLQKMYDQKKAACRHRTAIFLHQLQLLKAAHPQEYTQIEARGIGRGGVHANIEISVDGGKTFEQLELGGYEAKEQYTDAALPPMRFSSKKSVDAPKPVFSNILKQIDKGRGKNTLLCLKDPSDIYACVSHIRNLYQDTDDKRPIFYVDSPDQLRTSLKRLKLNDARTECDIIDPPAGLLHDFLIAHQKSDPAPIIIINWDNFKPSDIVQFNSVIDVDTRRVDNTPIPKGATIVGLHSHNEKMMDLLGDSSFVSRHATGGVHDLTSALLPLLPVKESAEAAVSGILRINLHRSPRWLDILIGKAFVDKDKLCWQDGQLLKILSDLTISQIEFINPPFNDRVFNNFVADFRAGLPLTVLNQTIALPGKYTLQIIEKPEFTEGVTLNVTHVSSLQKDAFIINASTFEQCLHGKKINIEGFLATEKGLLAAHANQTLKLCLHDNLSDSQWSLLLETAKAHNVTLDLSVTNNVKLPAEIKFIEFPALDDFEEKTSNQFIVSDDVEYNVSALQKELKESVKIIDLSEVNLDDLFCKVDYSLSDRNFKFHRKLSDVWRALENGETVILKGRCSVEMLNYLSTLFSPDSYFFTEGEKHTFSGKLIVVADDSLKLPAWLNVEEKKIGIKQKMGMLELLADADAYNKPFIQLQFEKEKKQQAVLDLFASPALDDLSLQACEALELKRLSSVKNILSYSPFVLLEGAPGVGKSYFVRALENDRTIKFYRENDIEKWATDPDESIDPSDPEKGFRKKILFRDEINLRGSDCSQDRDLLNPRPSIFANGKHYYLSKNCKIMYAQNPLDYGGDRHEPKLFQDLPECKMQFEQMTPAFILHRILKPIFETTFDLVEAELRAKAIVQSDFDAMRSIRDLVSRANFECALHENPLPPEPRMGTKEVCFGKKNFILTTDRVKPYHNVLALLSARLFKRALPETAPDGARFGGFNGLVLQGPPGVGKSEFLEAILQDEYYSEVTDETPIALIESGKVYYRLRASVSPDQKLKILHEAFHKGAILIIDEIDSCQIPEEYLNAYLVGEDINGNRAKKTGFTILSTANGAAMKGREPLSEPLLSRMMALEFNEYSRDELIQVLEAKFVAPAEVTGDKQILQKDIIAFLIDGFLTEQNTNKESPPTFRDLYVVADDYFKNKFKQYNELGLSKAQHEFMLIYRDHSKLPGLLYRLILKELRADKLTSHEFSIEINRAEKYTIGSESLDDFCRKYPEFRRISPLPALSDTEQHGETCKLFALSCLMDHHIQKQTASLNVDSAAHANPKPFLHKNKREGHSLRAIAKKHTGSTVGEMYSIDALKKTAEIAGFSMTAHVATNEDDYIAHLKQLIDQNKAAEVIFNVNTKGNDVGMPCVNTESYNEHAATILGYIKDKGGNTQFIAYHWGQCWVFDGKLLAQSALSLQESSPVETFAKTKNSNTGKTSWSNVRFLHNTNPEIPDVSRRVAQRKSEGQTGLRGAILSINASLQAAPHHGINPDINQAALKNYAPGNRITFFNANESPQVSRDIQTDSRDPNGPTK
ncbi:MAG: hypothetical protein NTZ67_02330 [Gammaproteobacteria bacterium]|nr:hypothetical protein [Gammaproteobacteria bacterium]